MTSHAGINLDDLDLQILEILIKDARTPYLEIARVAMFLVEQFMSE